MAEENATASAVQDTALSRPELDYFFSIYFDIKIIYDAVNVLESCSEDLFNEAAAISEDYKKVSLQQIDRSEYDKLQELYLRALKLRNAALEQAPDAEELLAVQEKTVDSIEGAPEVIRDDEPGENKQRSIKANIFIAAMVLITFGAIVCLTVPLSWVQNTLGSIYYYGRVVRQDYEEAEKWYRKAAESGYGKAQFNLGLCYETGNGVEQDFEEAVKWYKKAADQDIAKAQFALAKCFEEGMGVERNYEEAIKWYKKAADLNHAGAQYNMGLFMEKNDTVEDHQKKAFDWYTKAAEQGFTKAQGKLGYCYNTGFGVKQDFKKSVEWLRKGAERGDALAQYYLALECIQERNQPQKGDNIAEEEKRNQIEAAHWMRKAARQDYVDAQYELGRFYEAGIGVKKNLTEAAKWYLKAAKNGSKKAENALKNIRWEDVNKAH